MITYADYPADKLEILYKSCTTPGSKVRLLESTSHEYKSKRATRWVSFEEAIKLRSPFMVDTPHHLFVLDVDEEFVQSGLGDKIHELLLNERIIHTVSTSGSDGWIVVINLWSMVNQSEGNDFTNKSLEYEINTLKQKLIALDPTAKWSGGNGIFRPKQMIRPPLSPYTKSGTLKLLYPTTIETAIKSINFGGVMNLGITGTNSTIDNLVNLKIVSPKRHPKYLSLALSLVNAGYHLEDYRWILENPHLPIGREFQERGLNEYKRSPLKLSKEIDDTWAKAIARVLERPKKTHARRLIPDWLLAAKTIIQNTNLPGTTKTKFICLLVSISQAAYLADTTTPTLAESRLTKLSGLSNKTISQYKKIGNESGLWTLSESPTNYGTLFTLNESIVKTTDIKSLNNLMGNRELISVNHVNNEQITHQIKQWLSSWQPHPLWRQSLVCGSKGHLVWSLIQSFPGIKKQDIQKFLQWSPRLTNETINTLEKYSMIFKNTRDGTYEVNADPDHWDFLLSKIRNRPFLKLAS